jgi:hypothetical protein
MFRPAVRLTRQLWQTGRLWAYFKGSVVPSFWRDRDARRPIIIMSPSGSGSTWIGALLGNLPNHVYVHEVKLCGGFGGSVLRLLQSIRFLVPGRLLFVLFEGFERARLWTLDAHLEHVNNQRPELVSEENLKSLQLGNMAAEHWNYDVVDSAGSHISIVPLLRKAYPNSILCYLFRDPRDVCVSVKYRKPFGKGLPIDYWAKAVRKDFEKCSRYQRDYQIDVLRYEDWLGDTAGQLRAFVERHGLTMSEDALEQAVLRHDAAAMKAGKTTAKGNLQVAQAGAWAKTISADEKESLRPILSNMLIELGYERSPDW